MARKKIADTDAPVEKPTDAQEAVIFSTCSQCGNPGDCRRAGKCVKKVK